MSVRVVARIRPLLKAEIEKDQILSIQNSSVKIPNPKNFSEEYSFQFNSVYDQDSSQQQIFEAEVAPTIKHLFQGFDVTLFAYGVTGTGKTHTMRGGKSLAERGLIPRMLSNIYRKRTSIEKASNGETNVDISMTYYEIYNDKVYDLFEAPEKRNATGLPIREAEGGKTVVVGLSEMPCSSLKEFEVLYDKANANRSVGSTKLNAHSSRSHAILCVKVTISTTSESRSSMISAIDLAGSEDNRRTGNEKERMVESASINKSLFVLAQCVEAISKKQHRIPYRESKMTRILSLGQNNGLMVMFLNLAPTKSYHLDTLSSLNFANRTKKIEIREVENEPIFKGPPRLMPSTAGSNIQRQPLRPLINAANANLGVPKDAKTDKPAKSFAVYSDKTKSGNSRSSNQRSSPLKRAAEPLISNRPGKQQQFQRPTSSFIRRGPDTQTITKATLESIVEQKVAEVLAARAAQAPAPAPEPRRDISAEVQARLDMIEKRLEGQEGERAEGLSYLFMAKQHQARGEDVSALKMYELAQPFFEGNEKLQKKIDKLRIKIAERKNNSQMESSSEETVGRYQKSEISRDAPKHRMERQDDRDDSYQDYHDNDYAENDESYSEYNDYESEDGAKKSRKKTQNKNPKPKKPKTNQRALSLDPLGDFDSQNLPGNTFVQSNMPPTPRTVQLISILNGRDVVRLKGLRNMGVKKAEAILEALEDENIDGAELHSWNDVLKLDVKGIGKKTWETMREGLAV